MNIVENEAGGLSELERMELSAAHEFVLDHDEKPDDWESLVDQSHLHTLKQEIMHWSFEELIHYCEALDVWEDPTKTKAVLDVIEVKTA